MLRKTKLYRRGLIVSIVMTMAFPFVSAGGDSTGEDWYCTDSKVHTHEYQKHLKGHLDRGAAAIAKALDKIYSNASLTTKEKETKTQEVLHKYLLRIKAGTGD